MHLRM